ncbi:tegument protein UL14 [Human betaherpesvirus 5]|uniref:Tegument protein UL14 n=1 Tax=Human cytomegalovirus TaxID=10359 RepID=A0A0G2TK45_HCMV|nr:tegument protein UL14 [Human betaherpesvirus 5]
MTSVNKQLLKDVMRVDLERQQHQFLRRTYGPQHRLTTQQALTVMRVAAWEQTRYSQRTTQCVAAHLLEQRAAVQQELQRARQLQSGNVDDALDSLTELKDTVDDVRATLVDSVSATCDLDLEVDDTV